MSGKRTSAADDAARMAQQDARRFQDLGMRFLPIRNDLLYDALQGRGTPSMDSAFEAQRAAIAEQGFQNERTAIQSLLAQGKSAVAGGNLQQLLQGGGGEVGKAIAQSRLNESLASVEQRQKILQMLMGQNVSSANQAVQSGAGQLQAIQMLPDYNKALAAAAGMGSIGYSLYQAWPQQQQPLPMGRHTTTIAPGSGR